MITALIVDDERHNIIILQSLLKENCPNIQILDAASSADSAFEKINILKPQLVFLDIRMPVKSGFDLLKMFSKIDFEVIFVSSYNEYAIQAFEFNALGYILKPIDYSKIISVVDKAIYKIESNQKDNSVLHFIKTLEEKTDYINKIRLHHGDNVILVNIRDIVLIETLIDNTKIKTNNQTSYYSSKDIKLFENMLMGFDFFIRVSRGVLININYIERYSKGQYCILQMKDGESIEVSRRKKTEVLEKIKSL